MLASLALFVLFALIRPGVSQNITCKDPTVKWWNNANQESPCLVFQRLVGLCKPGFVMYNTVAAPNVDTCIDSSCCCNSVAYSLYVACYACQWGVTSLPSNYAETYGAFLGVDSDEVKSTGLCPGPGGINVGTLQPEFAQEMAGDLPGPWAYVPVGLTDTWSYQLAFQQAAAGPSVASQSTPPNNAGPTNTPPSGSSISAIQTHKTSAGAIAGGVVGGVVAAAAAAFLIFLYLRRRRRVPEQVDPLRSPPHMEGSGVTSFSFPPLRNDSNAHLRPFVSQDASPMSQEVTPFDYVSASSASNSYIPKAANQGRSPVPSQYGASTASNSGSSQIYAPVPVHQEEDAGLLLAGGHAMEMHSVPPRYRSPGILS